MNPANALPCSQLKTVNERVRDIG